MPTVIRNKTLETFYIRGGGAIQEILPDNGIILGDGYEYDIVTVDDYEYSIIEKGK